MEVVVTSECSGQLWNACVWDPQTGTTLRTFKGGISASRSLHMIAGDYLISAQKDKPILHVILKLFSFLLLMYNVTVTDIPFHLCCSFGI